MFVPSPAVYEAGSATQAQRPLKVLLFAIQTSHIGSCRLPKALVGAGCEVAALALPSSLLVHSGYLSKHFPLRARRFGTLILRDLERAVAQFAADLLIPCDERAVLFVQHAAAREQSRAGHLSGTLLRCIERSLGDLGSLRARTLKNETVAIARAAGVAVPDSLPIEVPGDLDTAIARLGFPLVLKLSHGAGGHGVRFCEDEAGARKALGEFFKGRSRVKALRRRLVRRDWFPASSGIMAQQYVDGASAMSCAVAVKGKTLAVLSARTLQSTGKRGSPSSVASLERNEAIARMTTAMVEAFGASGVLSFDFILDASGNPMLLECNPRPTYIFHLAPYAGLDLARSLVDGFRGDIPATPSANVAPAAEIAFFPSEWRRSADSVAIRTAIHDVPWDEPDLIRAMMRPRLRNWRRRPIP